MIVDLIWLSIDNDLPEWSFGHVWPVSPAPDDLHACVVQNLPDSQADAWLFWDCRFGQPDPGMLAGLLETPDDLWHAGLKLGTSGQPDWIDYVAPTWMLNRDGDSAIEATSWRLSLRACLVRTEVLRQMGGPCPGFTTLEAAGLALGFRYIRNGVFTRHIPSLVPSGNFTTNLKIALDDQLRFLIAGFGWKWTYWACLRAAASGRATPVSVFQSLNRIKAFKPALHRNPYHHSPVVTSPIPIKGQISVLIPTLNRYPYLRTLLGQLRNQTLKPAEILVIDQTPEEGRDPDLRQEFNDLPIRWFDLHHAGQCSSRNFGLVQARGNWILFLDDDDEIPTDLVENHLWKLKDLRLRVSNGVAIEVGAGALPHDFTFQRLSDGFPTNNSLIHRDVLKGSGLFDLAYDHGQRADGDLGMRIYLSGERMVLNPDISVLHHHASRGGLRTHKARRNTYASSRSQLFIRVLPSVSDLYLARRYFSSGQVREMVWISLLGTFSLHGPFWKQVLKVLLGFLAIPETLLQLYLRSRKVEQLVKTFPQIPVLDP